MAGTIAFASLDFANAFLNAHRWNSNWTSATDEEKTASLVNATNMILQFCVFYGEDGTTVVKYDDPVSTSDPKIPDFMRYACCYEALYFLDLDNDPARPFPLGILGLIKTGSDTFSHEYEPPLFSNMARGLLEKNGAQVDDPFNDSNRFSRRMYLD